MAGHIAALGNGAWAEVFDSGHVPERPQASCFCLGQCQYKKKKKRIKILWLPIPKRHKACWEARHGVSHVQEGAQLSQIMGKGSPQTNQGSFSSIKVNAEAMVSKQQKAMTEVGSDRPARTVSESWAMPTAPLAREQGPFGSGVNTCQVSVGWERTRGHLPSSEVPGAFPSQGMFVFREEGQGCWGPSAPRDLTLGIWEMLRPMGMTVAPPHSLAHLSVARKK